MAIVTRYRIPLRLGFITCITLSLTVARVTAQPDVLLSEPYEQRRLMPEERFGAAAYHDWRNPLSVWNTRAELDGRIGNRLAYRARPGSEIRWLTSPAERPHSSVDAVTIGEHYLVIWRDSSSSRGAFGQRIEATGGLVGERFALGMPEYDSRRAFDLGAGQGHLLLLSDRTGGSLFVARFGDDGSDATITTYTATIDLQVRVRRFEDGVILIRLDTSRFLHVSSSGVIQDVTTPIPVRPGSNFDESGAFLARFRDSLYYFRSVLSMRADSAWPINTEADEHILDITGRYDGLPWVLIDSAGRYEDFDVGTLFSKDYLRHFVAGEPETQAARLAGRVQEYSAAPEFRVDVTADPYDLCDGAVLHVESTILQDTLDNGRPPNVTTRWWFMHFESDGVSQFPGSSDPASLSSFFCPGDDGSVRYLQDSALAVIETLTILPQYDTIDIAPVSVDLQAATPQLTGLSGRLLASYSDSTLLRNRYLTLAPTLSRVDSSESTLLPPLGGWMSTLRGRAWRTTRDTTLRQGNSDVPGKIYRDSIVLEMATLNGPRRHVRTAGGVVPFDQLPPDPELGDVAFDPGSGLLLVTVRTSSAGDLILGFDRSGLVNERGGLDSARGLVRPLGWSGWDVVYEQNGGVYQSDLSEQSVQVGSLPDEIGTTLRLLRLSDSRLLRLERLATGGYRLTSVDWTDPSSASAISLPLSVEPFLMPRPDGQGLLLIWGGPDGVRLANYEVDLSPVPGMGVSDGGIRISETTSATRKPVAVALEGRLIVAWENTLQNRVFGRSIELSTLGISGVKREQIPTVRPDWIDLSLLSY